MFEGYAYCRMIFDEGRPVDWLYLDVNPAFENLTGSRAPSDAAPPSWSPAFSRPTRSCSRPTPEW